MFQFKLPDLGEGIHEGEILLWHTNEGDEIKEDDPLVDVETDKASVTIPSPKGGKVHKLNGSDGDIIQVGTVLAVIDDGTGEALPEEAVVAKETPATETQAVVPVTLASHEPGRPVPASPATRRLARELGVDLRAVAPSGPGGRVTASDVRTAKEAPVCSEPTCDLQSPKEKAADVQEIVSTIQTSPEKLTQTEFAAQASNMIPLLDIEELPDFSQFGPVDEIPLRSIRRKIAHKMVTSMIMIPHVSHMDEADVTDLDQFRKKEKDKRKGMPGGHLTMLSFVIKAAVSGLKATPAFNASLDPFKEKIIYKKFYNIGIAVDTPNGLIVPVIKDAHLKSIMQISADIEDYAARARVGELTVDELKGGTFTITNIGPLGGTALLPTINYPEVAILAMGKAQDKPVVRDGEIVIRKMLPLTLAFDHRIADGADAARFVSEMTNTLSDPSLLLLET